MRNFAAAFQVLRQLQESLAFIVGLLSEVCFTLLRQRAEIALHYRDHQTARGNFGAGPGQRRAGRRPPNVVDSRYTQDFVHISLADVFVHGVVGNVAHTASSISLGIKDLVVVSDRRQQRVFGLFGIFVSDLRLGERGLKLWAVLACAYQRVIQGKAQRRLRGPRRLLRSACRPRTRSRQQKNPEDISQGVSLHDSLLPIEAAITTVIAAVLPTRRLKISR